MTHSPEPWTVQQLEVPDDCTPLATIYDPNCEIIQHILTAECGWFHALSPADATRIVACVNFCRGISHEELTRYGELGTPAIAWAKHLMIEHIKDELYTILPNRYFYTGG